MSEPTPQDRRVLIIGWDGGTWRVFRPLVEKGLMPRLKSLMDRGAFGIMTSTIPPLTPPAWTTLLTGLPPERHGVFGFLEGLLPGEAVPVHGNDVRPLSALSIRKKDLLELLGEAGRRVMAVNVPMSYPPRPINGFMVTGMMTPDNADNFTWPPELKNELDDYQIDVVTASDRKQRRIEYESLKTPSLVRRCTQVLGRRLKNVLRLGRSHSWDFGIVVFTGTDRIFHKAWHEVAALAAAEAPENEVQRLLVQFFKALDDALGALVGAFDDASVMVVSDHGFGPWPTRTVYPDVLLEKHGLLFRRSPRPARWGLERFVRRTIRRAIETVLGPARANVLLGKGKGRQARMMETVDPERTLAYYAMFDWYSLGAVRLMKETTAGLDEAQRKDLVDRIISVMRSIRDPQTGEPVVLNIWRRQDLFPDPVVDFLPEVVMEFRESYTGRIDPLAEAVFGGAPDSAESGIHDTQGMFVLAGAPIRTAGEVPPLKLADVAPTVLYLSGLSVPTNMQGEIPLTLFTEDHVQAHPPQTGTPGTPPTPPSDTPRQSYTPDQEKHIRDRLRQLGYLE